MKYSNRSDTLPPPPPPPLLWLLPVPVTPATGPIKYVRVSGGKTVSDAIGSGAENPNAAAVACVAAEAATAAAVVSGAATDRSQNRVS